MKPRQEEETKRDCGFILTPGISSIQNEFEGNEGFVNEAGKVGLANTPMQDTMKYKEMPKTIQRKTYQNKYDLEVRTTRTKEGKQLLFSGGP